MSTLVSLAAAGVPGLEAALTLVHSTYSAVENVKVYRQQCREMSKRCTELLEAYEGSAVGLEGQRVLVLLDELSSVIERINKKVNEWAALSRVRSFLQQSEIKESIDRLNKDLDAACKKTNVQLNLELARGQIETRAIQDRDKADIRTLLETIVQSQEDMKALLSMQSPEPVVRVMGSLQNELHKTGLDPAQEKSFRKGLWELHEHTSELPPLADLTGQVTVIGDRAHAHGTFNDIYKGKWLEHESVALRLPRPLTNDQRAQKRFHQEVEIWRRLRHVNVVPLYGIFFADPAVYSVSPWMDNGTSLAYVQAYPNTDRLQILHEAVIGLEYLHGNNVVHGDLRGANVLINAAGVARLSDFGLSKFLEECNQGTTSPASNPRWAAPELCQQTGILSTYSDIWSFGMVCLEIVTGRQPYAEISRDLAVLNDLVNGRLPARPPKDAKKFGLSDELWLLMHRHCWTRKPTSRPSAGFVKEKLAELRGLAAPTSPTRSLFRISKRPSTAGTVSSIGSSSSGGSRTGLGLFSISRQNSRISEEPLSPISLQISSDMSSPSQILSPSVMKAASTSPRIGRDFLAHDRFSSDDFERPSTVAEAPISTSLPTPNNMPAYSPRSVANSLPGAISSASSSQLDSLQRALADREPIVKLDSSGTVRAATLQGLADRLIENSNTRVQVEFKNTLLICCVDFVHPTVLFDKVCARFHEAEEKPIAKCVEIQMNIFTVCSFWISSQHLHIDSLLLEQMKYFYSEVSGLKKSKIMQEKTTQVLQHIRDRESSTESSTETSPLIHPFSPGRVTKRPNMTPKDLAIAMTVFEGDIFKKILPSDYLRHLHQDSEPVMSIITVQNAKRNIGLWVQKMVLQSDNIASRVDALRFLINTAQECRNLDNFASMSNILHALQSNPVKQLERTRAELSQQILSLLLDLEILVSPSTNYHAYRKALHQAMKSSDSCIPWLDVHIQDFHSVYAAHKSTVQHDGKPLINFQRYVDFTAKVKVISHIKPPHLDAHRGGEVLIYLENQLRSVARSHADFQDRSNSLKEVEDRDHRTRTKELQSLGFRVPSSSKRA